MVETKRCNRCGKTKPVSEFNRNKSTKSGYSVYCTVCSRKYYKEWSERPDIKKGLKNKRNSEEYKKYKRKYDRQYRDNHKVEDWARSTLKTHRKAGCTTLVTKEELVDLARKSKYCNFCGIELMWERKGHVKGSPTLDRIDNELEIRIDNVQILCWSCNTTKMDRTMEEFIEYCRMIGERFGE